MRCRMRSALSLICLALLLPAPASACSVPVFRFALERWPADAFTVTIIHHGPLTGEQRAMVAALEKPGAANLRLRFIDDAAPPDAAARAYAKRHKGSARPCLVAEYADASEKDLPAWTAPLNADSVKGLLDSPIRQESARRILAGQSAVWVLLECGDAKKDEKAVNLLEEHLAKMPSVLKLPIPDDALAEEILATPGRPAPRIEFSLLRLSRRDAAEAALVSMLLGTEDDLRTFDEPIAFPIFGRGRALEALVGKGITEDNIRKQCAFLIGACSCEVKRINPGRDLLMAVDWDKALPPGERLSSEPRSKKVRKPTPPPAADPLPVPEETPPPEEDLAPVETPTSPLRLAFLALAGLAAISLIVGVRIMR